MTAAIEETDTQPASLGELPGRDAAVLVLGADEYGDDALAVWQVSAWGKPTGAWVVRQEDTFTDSDTARRLLGYLERRAITGGDPAGFPGLLQRLTATAKLDVGQWWQGQLFDPVEAFEEMRCRRELYGRTVAAARYEGRNVTPLDWHCDYSGCAPPGDFTELHELAPRRTPPGAPVISEVLGVCGVLGWLIECWQETEHVKSRRNYVSDAHGAPEALPPSWLKTARNAERNRLPL